MTGPNFEDMPIDEQFFAGFDKQVLKVSPPWSREAEDRVNQLLGQVAAKEMECQRLREALAAEPERKPMTEEQIDALPLPKEPDYAEKIAFARAIDRFRGIE